MYNFTRLVPISKNLNEFRFVHHSIDAWESVSSDQRKGCNFGGCSYIRGDN